MARNINKEWHEKNRMPKNATFDQRVAWHLEHQKQCSCMPIPAKLAEQMMEKGVDIRDAQTQRSLPQKQ